MFLPFCPFTCQARSTNKITIKKEQSCCNAWRSLWIAVARLDELVWPLCRVTHRGVFTAQSLGLVVLSMNATVLPAMYGETGQRLRLRVLQRPTTDSSVCRFAPFHRQPSALSPPGAAQGCTKHKVKRRLFVLEVIGWMDMAENF